MSKLKRSVHDLEKIASELRIQAEQAAHDIREGGLESQQGFEKLTRAVHKLHRFIFVIPDQLLRIAQKLKETNEDEH